MFGLSVLVVPAHAGEVCTPPNCPVPIRVILPGVPQLEVFELDTASFIVTAVIAPAYAYPEFKPLTLDCTCPTGASITPYAENETSVSWQFSWTPSKSQGGTNYSVFFQAMNSYGFSNRDYLLIVVHDLPDIPPITSLQVSTSTSLVGLRVQISGAVTSRVTGEGISAISVNLSFSLDQGGTWTAIGTPRTDERGQFSVQWLPTLTGEFIIKATAMCYCFDYYDLQYHLIRETPGRTAVVDLVVIPVETGQVFSVSTNSTLSGLSYNAQDSTLTFTLSGKTGETGRVDASIAKSLLSDPNRLRLKANSTDLPFNYVSVGDSWLVTFQVQYHSAYIMTMEIGGSSPLGRPAITLINYLPYIVGAGLAATIGSYLLYRKSKVRRSVTRPAEPSTFSSSSFLARRLSFHPLV